MVRRQWVEIVWLVCLFLAGCSAADAHPMDGSDMTPSVASIENTPTPACPVTQPVLATPPEDPAVMNEPAPGYYYLNVDRSIWAGAGWTPKGDTHFWHAGPDGNKVGWFRPEGAAMEAAGRRLDAPAEPMQAEFPCCYPTRFQASGLYFPSEGCWEVTVKAANSMLKFVVEVEPEAGSK